MSTRDWADRIASAVGALAVAAIVCVVLGLFVHVLGGDAFHPPIGVLFGVVAGAGYRQLRRPAP